ncbi:MAG: DCC1-like thiol-disulfide oxidoreductase family protein [Planctomycetaceae bacterium]
MPASEPNSMSTEPAATITGVAGAIVFFDGVCGLCDQTVTFLLDHDHDGRLLFAPLQGSTATRLLPAEYRDRLDTLVLRLPDGECHTRSAAAVRILWRLGGVWKWLGGLLWLIPKPFRDLGYRAVAATRYRLFGKRDTCRLPTLKDQQRMLT